MKLTGRIKRFETIWQLAGKAFAKYKWQIVALAALGFLSGLLEGIGVNALIPLFSFAIGNSIGGTDFLSRQIAGAFNFLHIAFTVRYLLFFIILLFLGKALLMILFQQIKIRVVMDYEARTRQDLFQKILSSGWPHLMKQKLGHLETILITDVPMASNLFTQVSGGLMLFTGLVVYALVAINISAVVTVLTVVLGIISFLVFRPFLRRIKNLAYERTKLQKEIAHHVSENLAGIKIVKASQIEEAVSARGQGLFQAGRVLGVRSGFIKNMTTSFLEPIGAIFVGAIFAYLYKNPGFNFVALVAIVYLIQKIFLYIQQLQSTYQNLNDCVPHLASVLNYQRQADVNLEKNSGRRPFQFKKELEFQDVSFFYEGTRQGLDGLNFKIRKGEMVGLIGPSGVGKTTLVDLILRLLTPTKGQILLDGFDIREIDLASWRKNIGYVSQDMFLLNDTIANNIRFYNPEITGQRIEEAVAQANIKKLVETRPERLESVIGERGVFLSVGERQRIVIARVLARQPSLLILDEATSALDNESEAVIQKVLRSLKRRITILIIAHRLSTIRDADRLVVLEKGTIKEEGRPDELLQNKDSYFAKVYNIVK